MKLYEKIGKTSIQIAYLYENNKKDIRISYLQKKLNNYIKEGLIREKGKIKKEKK